MRTVLVDYGAGNVRSVQRALEAASVPVEVRTSPSRADGADTLVLPGQGHFGQAMQSFRRSGFEPLLRDHLAAGKPFLGICVGLQLLMTSSEEAPDVPGLGLLDGVVRRFPAGGPSVPHMGWNEIVKEGDPPLLRSLPDRFHAYFAHSYWVDMAPSSVTSGNSRHPNASTGTTTYGDVRFASVVSVGAVHATQFHPEKSQQVGLTILESFGRLARAAIQGEA